MRNGQKIKEGKYPYLKPFNKEFKTKWVSKTSEFYNILNKFEAEQTESGYKISFKGKNKENLLLFIESKDEQFCLKGNFPYYFLKSFLNFFQK